jgi:hypothetical protein
LLSIAGCGDPATKLRALWAIRHLASRIRPDATSTMNR